MADAQQSGGLFGIPSGALNGLGGLFGAAGDIFGGFERANSLNEEAQFYKQSAALTKASGQLKLLAQQRQTYQMLGATRAAAAGNGLKLSGSAESILRSNAGNAAIERNLIGINNEIAVKGLLEQEQQAKEEAQGAEIGGIMSGVGDIFKAAGSFAGMPGI